MTTILGHPWDFLRENAMLDHMGNAKEEDYMKKYWKVFTEKLKNDHKKENELLEKMKGI